MHILLHGRGAQRRGFDRDAEETHVYRQAAVHRDGREDVRVGGGGGHGAEARLARHQSPSLVGEGAARQDGRAHPDAARRVQTALGRDRGDPRAQRDVDGLPGRAGTETPDGLRAPEPHHRRRDIAGQCSQRGVRLRGRVPGEDRQLHAPAEPQGVGLEHAVQPNQHPHAARQPALVHPQVYIRRAEGAGHAVWTARYQNRVLRYQVQGGVLGQTDDGDLPVVQAGGHPRDQDTDGVHGERRGVRVPGGGAAQVPGAPG